MKSHVAFVHTNVVNHASLYNLTVTFCTQNVSVNVQIVVFIVVSVLLSNVGWVTVDALSDITVVSVVTVNAVDVLTSHDDVVAFFASHVVTA